MPSCPGPCWNGSRRPKAPPRPRAAGTPRNWLARHCSCIRRTASARANWRRTCSRSSRHPRSPGPVWPPRPGTGPPRPNSCRCARRSSKTRHRRQPFPVATGRSPAMSETAAWPADRRITITDLQAATDRGERWSMLTSYDTLTAGVFEQAGVRALLVGDTSAEMVLGHPDTLPVTMDQLISMVQAVVRGTRTAQVVADLPFGSYQAGPQAALASAVRHLKEGGAQAVKLEGGRRVVPQVQALTGAGIPVMGHLGLTPQSVNVLGGMRRVQGRGDAGQELLADARALERAGAFAVVLESVPADLGRQVSAALRIPTVGIGAGPHCDAQIMVWQDMAGLTTGRLPRFVKRYADVRGTLLDAAHRYVTEVARQPYPPPR